MYQLTSLHACELSGLADGQPTSAAPHTDTRTYAEGVSTGGRLCAVASQTGSLCMTCTPTQPALGARLDSPEELAACCAPRTQTRDRARVRENRRGAHSGFYLIICFFFSREAHLASPPKGLQQAHDVLLAELPQHFQLPQGRSAHLIAICWEKERM
jgi:hypothetical protein